jgi:hypothetical protein
MADGDPEIVVLSLDALRRTIGHRVAADDRAIRGWILGGSEPDFAAIAEYAVPALRTILARGWIERDPGSKERLGRTLKGAADPALPGFRGAVAETVALIARALVGGPPPRPPPRRKAAQQSLGKKDRA